MKQRTQQPNPTKINRIEKTTNPLQSAMHPESAVQLRAPLTPAGVLRMQRMAGNRAVSQMVQRQDEVSASSIARQLSQDEILETLAHDIVYQDQAINEEGRALLEQGGYRALNLYSGPNDFQMRGFVASDPENHPKTPVLAFRGTESFLDLVSDLTEEGVGMDQFEANLDAIQQAFESLGGQAIVTGHSLGGALAQMAAATFPQMVARIVTFQSPGIPAHMVEAIEMYNQGVDPAERLRATHYRAEGDIVDDAGERFAPGEIYTLPTDVFSLLSVGGAIGGGLLGNLSGAAGGFTLGRAGNAHTTFILGELLRLRREDPEEFAEVTLERERGGSERGGMRPVEAARSGAGSVMGGAERAATSTLEYLTSDDRIREQIENDPGYLANRTFDEKVEMIRILMEGMATEGDINAAESIIRSMPRTEREVVRTQLFDTLFGDLAPAARWQLGNACQ